MGNINDGYGMCLNEWVLDKSIKNELRLLLIISSLCAEKGYCFASNEYFSKLFDEPVQTISRKIKTLEKKGYVKIDYKKNGIIITNREIRLTKMLTAVNKNVNRTINKNVKDNNTSISSSINITSNINNKSINNKYKLNEFNLYNNFNENLQCECISSTTNERCLRKSSFNINGKNYCNQHARKLIPSIEDGEIKETTKRFIKPTIEEIQEYCNERNNEVNAEQFYDFYESKNWYVGKNKMKDWKASVRTWERNNTKKPKNYRESIMESNREFFARKRKEIEDEQKRCE